MKAPMEIEFSPGTLVCFIVMTVVFIIIIAKGRND